MSSLRKTFILFVITDLVVTRGPRLYNALRNHFSQGQHLHQVSPYLLLDLWAHFQVEPHRTR
jgi:hypothetical protein